jgi:hypothetical protein
MKVDLWRNLAVKGIVRNMDERKDFIFGDVRKAVLLAPRA